MFLTKGRYKVTLDTVMIDIVILAMLLSGPQYGYQLKREAGWIAGSGELHNNLVYPALQRFRQQKWVTRRAVPGERGQTRQQYELTAAGRQYLFERIRDFSEADAASENAFRLRVGLFEILKPEEREAILGRREEYLERRDQRLDAIQSNLEPGKYGREILGYMRKQVESEREWIRHLRRVAKRDAI
jgi:PadR family transcriptional regulator, regulatory protein PadR